MSNENKKEAAQKVETSEQQPEVLKEVVIQYVSPLKFQVFINGKRLENVKRFAIDIANPGHIIKDAETPTYTVEQYLNINK